MLHEDSSSAICSVTESDTTDSEVQKVGCIYETPRKKRYMKSIKHGLSKKRARYHSHDAITNAERTDIETNSYSYSVSQNIADYDSNASFETQSLDTLSSDSDSSFTDLELSDIYTESDDSTSFLEWSSSGENTCDTSFQSSSEQKDENSGDAQEHIYKGCRHSLLTSYTMVMLFVMKHSLSKEAFADLLLLIATHLPISSVYSKSIYKLKEFLKDFIKIKEPKVHIMCEICHQLLDGEYCTSTLCRGRNAKTLEFHDLHLKDQLRDLFQERNFYDMIQKHRQQQEENEDVSIKDICDGSQYKNLITNRSMEDNVLNLTFTMNTDGVALFSSSKKGNLWPIYIAINEIPIKLRFSKKYILPSFLYCHSEKPNMLTYMSPQMKTLKTLSEEGMEVVTPAGKLLVKAHLLAVTVDLPAKAMVANMKQFNGKFGCSFCMDEGESRPNCPMHRFWPFKEHSLLRTHHSYKEDVMEAVRSKNAVNGVKGASPLMVLRYVDIPKVFVVDWMHCVLLGVTKALMKLWFSSSHREDTFYVGDKLSYINQRLQKIEIPDFMSRTQRSLEDHAHWKATECREWLLHFSVPVLEGVLPPVAHVHYMLLVSAINLLNKEKVLMDEIDYAEMLLLDFCRLFPEVYGRMQQTMNVHQLKHLPHFVRLYGPLFTMSCFGFESMNAHLKSMVHGTRFINSQVCFAVAMTKALPQLVKTFNNVHEDIQSLAERLSSKFIRSTDKEDPNKDYSPIVVGRKSSFHPTEEEDIIVGRFLQENNFTDVPLFKFLRLKKDGELIYSRHYQRAKTRNAYTVLLNAGDVVIVLYFLLLGDQLLAMVEKLDTVNASFPICDDVLQNHVLRKYQNMKLCHHIREVTSHKELKIIPVSCITKKCVYMKLNNDKTYVSIPPNLLEHD